MTASRSLMAAGFAGDGARDEHGVRDRRDDRRSGPVRQAATVEQIGEFGRDVVELHDVSGPEPAAVAQRSSGVRVPGTHVGGVRAGEDLAHERAPRWPRRGPSWRWGPTAR